MDERESVSLRALGNQCRKLARGASTREVATSLSEMAEAYEQKAQKAEAKEKAAEPVTEPRPEQSG